MSKHHLCSHADSKHSLPLLTMELDGIPPSIAVKMCFKFRPLYSSLYLERDPRNSFKRAWVCLMSRYGLLAKEQVLDSNTDSGDRSHCVIVMNGEHGGGDCQTAVGWFIYRQV